MRGNLAENVYKQLTKFWIDFPGTHYIRLPLNLQLICRQSAERCDYMKTKHLPTLVSNIDGSLSWWPYLCLRLVDPCGECNVSPLSELWMLYLRSLARFCSSLRFLWRFIASAPWMPTECIVAAHLLVITLLLLLLRMTMGWPINPWRLELKILRLRRGRWWEGKCEEKYRWQEMKRLRKMTNFG